jgi:hypothetical protein
MTNTSDIKNLPTTSGISAIYITDVQYPEVSVTEEKEIFLEESKRRFRTPIPEVSQVIVSLLSY